MNQSRILVGVIGAGANTRKKHIPGLLALDGVEVVGVCNRSRESGQRVAEEFGISKVYDSWRALIDDPDIDAVVIGTWPYMHKVLTCAGLEAGKHVLCEARMAMNAAEAHAMLTTARNHPSLTAQIVPSPFTLAFDATIQGMLRDKFFGEIVAIEARHVTGAFVDYDEPLSWRQDSSLSGLNILTMGIWYEALARWVGHARTVFARTKRVVTMRPHPNEKRLVAATVPDHIDIVADMECGAQARMQFSAVLGLAHATNEIWLYGSEGTLRLNAAENKLYAARRGDTVLSEVQVPESDRGSWRVEEEFVNAIRGIETVKLTTLEEGVRYMEFTEAVARSGISGKTVSLPLLIH